MIRELQAKDKEMFVLMVQGLYRSEATLSEIPLVNIETTFKTAIEGSPYIKAFVIEEKEEIAGYVQLSFTYSNEVGGIVAFVEELFIREEYRSQGLGTKALDFIHKEYEHKVKRFRLEVTKANRSVMELYARKGYQLNEYIQMVYNQE
ncbi:MAG: GNAT family N-acetyltransferase [Mobilitalea sp.]